MVGKSLITSFTDWQRDGTGTQALLPVLSAYLGHVEPASTYGYLTAVPELMQLAAARLERLEGGSR
jgi:hypothetical protein